MESYSMKPLIQLAVGLLLLSAIGISQAQEAKPTPAQAPASATMAALNDADARAIRELELEFVRGQSLMAQARLQFSAAEERVRKAQAAYAALKQELSAKYKCEKCELLEDLSWQRPAAAAPEAARKEQAKK